MTRPRDLSSAIHQHYQAKQDSQGRGQREVNDRYRMFSQDAMAELSAQVDADPLILDTLNKQQRYQLSMHRLRQANHADRAHTG